MRMKPLKDRPELRLMIERAVAAFKALSPEQQKAHLREQRKSWVIGEMMLEHPEMSREQAEAIYERLSL